MLTGRLPLFLIFLIIMLPLEYDIDEERPNDWDPIFNDLPIFEDEDELDNMDDDVDDDTSFDQLYPFLTYKGANYGHI